MCALVHTGRVIKLVVTTAHRRLPGTEGKAEGGRRITESQTARLLLPLLQYKPVFIWKLLEGDAGSPTFLQ